VAENFLRISDAGEGREKVQKGGVRRRRGKKGRREKPRPQKKGEKRGKGTNQLTYLFPHVKRREIKRKRGGKGEKGRKGAIYDDSDTSFQSERGGRGKKKARTMTRRKKKKSDAITPL